MKEYDILMVGSLPSFLGSRNYGGVAQVVWSLSKSYAQRGIDFALGANSRYYGGDKKVDGVPIYGAHLNIWDILKTFKLINNNLEYFSKKPLRYKLHLIYSLFFLNQLNNRIKFKIIHTHDVINQIPLAAYLLRLNIPVVATIHSYNDVIKQSAENVQKQISKDHSLQLENVKFLVHVSKSVKNQSQLLGINWNCEDKVIYNSANAYISEINKYPDIISKDNQICFVGSFIKGKGINRLLSAIKELNGEIDKVLFIGRGNLKRNIRKYTSELRIQVDIYGTLSPDEVAEQMTASSVFVMPSISESFGLVYIESLLCGTPVIGFHTIIEEFQQVLQLGEPEKDWLIPYNHGAENAQDLAEKMRVALRIKNRPTYNVERENIRRQINQKLSWDKIAEQYIEVYRRVLETYN